MCIRDSSYASFRTRENKEIVKAVLTMFIQGATEIYKLQNNWYLSSQSRKYEIYQEFLQLAKMCIRDSNRETRHSPIPKSKRFS